MLRVLWRARSTWLQKPRQGMEPPLGAEKGKGEEMNSYIPQEDHDNYCIHGETISNDIGCEKCEEVVKRNKHLLNTCAHGVEVTCWSCQADAVTYKLKAEIERKQELDEIIEREFTPTLRDQFAMAALTGLLAGVLPDTDDLIHNESFARSAWSLADAMMEARGKK